MLYDKRFHEVRKEMLKTIKEDNLVNTFYMYDLKNVKKQIENWDINFPEVTPYYGTKFNSDPELLKTIIQNKCGIFMV